MSDLPLAITISRQLGSGGAYIGQKLAGQLGVLYLDREILSEAAQKLRISLEDLEPQDETKMPFWKSIVQMFAYDSPDLYIPPEMNVPNDKDLYKAESEIIRKVAREHSAVIIGRGGSYLLREHPRHLSIFLHADQAVRQKRIEALYQLSAVEAQKLIEKSDHERSRYIQGVAGADWNDARLYHLTIDTGRIDLDSAKDMIMAYIKSRFGEI